MNNILMTGAKFAICSSIIDILELGVNRVQFYCAKNFFKIKTFVSLRLISEKKMNHFSLKMHHE